MATPTARVAARPLRVVYLGAGGDHHGVAAALMALVHGVYGPGVAQTRTDLFGGGRWPMPAWVARLLHAATDRPWMVAACAVLLRPLALRGLRGQLPSEPDLLVAVHASAAQCLQALAASLARPPRTAIVVTDYAAHAAWFGRADHVVVSSPGAAVRALELGVPAAALTLNTLLPCRRPAAGWVRGPAAPRLRVVAVARGRSGLRLVQLLRQLDTRPAASRLSVDVLCGPGLALRRSVQALGGELRRLEVRALDEGSDLPGQFAAADLALLQASPQTLSEALAAGTPVLTFDWRMHEDASARLLSQLGCGLASREPAELLLALEAVATDGHTLARWAAAARSAAAQAPDEVFVQRLFARLALSLRQRAGGGA